MDTVSTLVKLDMALGECPRWNELEQAWYWVDILGHVLYRHQTQYGLTESRLLDFAPACFAFTENNHIVLTGSTGVFWLADFASDLEHIGHPEQHLPENRFNDGVTTPDGGFIAGTIGDGSQPDGTRYQLGLNDKSLNYNALPNRYTIINGQAFSPDGRWYYVTDTPTQKIWRYGYDAATQEFSEGELFYQCAADEFPDGAAVDADGNYWVAMYGGAKISVISPQGVKLKDIPLPVSQPTMVAFGGAELNQLLVTSAAQTLTADDLLKEPLAGSTLLLDVDVTGTLPTRMRD